MTALDQPDLFGEYDAEQERVAAWREWMGNEQTCPCCSTVEPNGMLLSNNHGIDMDGTICGFQVGEHPNYGAQCLAQNLVTNHITYGVRRWLNTDRDIVRGRELGLDVDAIIAAAKQRRPARREWLPPGHRFVSLDCPACGHPMGAHRWRDSKGRWMCVKGCGCRKAHADGVVGPHTAMWRRDKLLAEAGAV